MSSLLIGRMGIIVCFHCNGNIREVRVKITWVSRALWVEIISTFFSRSRH